MNIFLDLFNNATLLLSLAMLHSFLLRQVAYDSCMRTLFAGFLFGTVAVLGMTLSVEMIPGVIFDGRSLVLSMAGLFGGPLAAGVAAIIAASYRIYLGGAGVGVGLAVIFATSTLGVAGFYLRKSANLTLNWKSLYLFGLVVHLAFLACLLALPLEIRWQVLTSFAVPMIVVYPVATVLFGLLLLLVEDSIQSHRDLLVTHAQLLDAEANAHIGHWWLEPGTFKAYWADEIYRILGITPDLPPGLETLEKCVHQDDWGELQASIMRTLNQGIKHQQKYRVLRSNGEERWVDCRGKAVRDEQGDIQRVVGTFQDVTRRKAREDKIEAQEVLLEAILESTADAIVACDPEGRLSLLNRAARALLKANEVPLGSTSWPQAYDLYLADGVTRIQSEQEPLLLALQGQTMRELEMVVASPDGEAHSVLASAAPIIDAAGNSLGAVISMHDITEHKRVKDQIKRTNLLLSEMGSMAKIGGWELDLATMEPKFTEETFRIHELSSRQVPKLEDGIAYYAPECRPLVENVVRQAIEKNQPYDIEVPFITAKGRNIWVRTQGKAYFEDGKAIGLFGALQDISERKKIENELRASHEHLEQQVEQRTGELRKANQHLQELDRLKSLFIASMSHELRTPLNSIIGFTGMMLQEIPGPIGAKQRDYLTRVASAGRHLLSLINDVIDIAKVEAGKAQPYIERVDLTNLVEEAVEQIRNEAAKKGLSLQVFVPEGLVITTDRRRLLQCLLNYLSNAMKYTLQGGITLRVSESEPGASDLDIAVSDTGIGIAAADQERLFQQFSRIDSDITRRTAGTGLGLYLTRKLATGLLGGRVSMDSEPGHGSTFRLHLPREIKT